MNQRNIATTTPLADDDCNKMAPARILLTTARAAAARRAFSAAPARFDAATASIGATPLPVVRKPVGALRGGYVSPLITKEEHG